MKLMNKDVRILKEYDMRQVFKWFGVGNLLATVEEQILPVIVYESEFYWYGFRFIVL